MFGVDEHRLLSCGHLIRLLNLYVTRGHNLSDFISLFFLLVIDLGYIRIYGCLPLFGHDIAREDNELILVVRFELLGGYAQGLIGTGLPAFSAFSQE